MVERCAERSLVTTSIGLPAYLASDAVGPAQSSLPQSHRQLTPPSVSSTPPRKPVPQPSATHRTCSKSDSSSLFTPSDQDQNSLFNPSTPSVTRSPTRVMFTPRSSVMLHRSGARRVAGISWILLFTSIIGFIGGWRSSRLDEFHFYLGALRLVGAVVIFTRHTAGM